MVIGEWELKKRLGKGGNGEVHLVEKAGVAGAIKRLSAHHLTPSRIARFQDEVVAMKACADIPGVLPILDDGLAASDDQRPWFVMGLARPLTDELAGAPPLGRVVEAVRDIAVILQAMHARGFSHRDIKPDNLFFYEGAWAVGDFGLVSFEGKTSETVEGERIGPIYYIAPEMLNTAVQADGRPADVFSLAKTLWVLATGQRFPLPGAYDAHHPAFRIDSYVAAARTQPLDRLIASATSVTPGDRPSMAQFVAELTAWLHPPERPETSLTLDIGGHVLELARRRAVNDAERGRQHRHHARSDEVGRRLRESHRQFAKEIEAALVGADVFERVDLEIDNVQWGFNLTAHVPGTLSGPAAIIVLRFGCHLMDEHSVKASAYIDLEVRTGAGFRALLWDKTADFLEGGSEEPLLLAQLREGMRQEFGLAITKALELSIGEQAQIGHPTTYRFEVIDVEGLPVGNAEIFIVSGDGVFLRATTGLDGVATVGPTPFANPVCLISHARYRGYHAPMQKALVNVVMEPNPVGGSMICTRSWSQVSGLVGQVNLIRDTSDRTYMYADNVAIDGGKTQPVPVALGRATQLQGADGARVRLTPRAINGQCFLLDIEIPQAQALSVEGPSKA